jgi:hypothetical protein
VALGTAIEQGVVGRNRESSEKDVVPIPDRRDLVQVFLSKQRRDAGPNVLEESVHIGAQETTCLRLSRAAPLR